MACKLFIKSKFSPQKAPLKGEAEYISKVAKTEKEVSSLIEARFEYVTDFEGAKSLEKPKCNVIFFFYTQWGFTYIGAGVEFEPR